MYLIEKEKQYYDAQQKRYLDEVSRIQEKVEKAVKENQIEIAKSLLLTTLSNEEIAKHTGLSVNQIQHLRNEKI
jgi:predicted transposase YdaD